MARKVLHHPEYGLNLVGFVDTHPRERRSYLDHLPVRGELDELLRLVQAHDVDRVIFAFTDDSHAELLPLIRQLREAGVQVDLVPRLFEVIGPKVDIHTVEGVSLIGLPPVRPSSLRPCDQAIGRSGRRLTAAGGIGARLRRRGAADQARLEGARLLPPGNAWAKGCASSRC